MQVRVRRVSRETHVRQLAVVLKAVKVVMVVVALHRVMALLVLLELLLAPSMEELVALLVAAVVKPA